MITKEDAWAYRLILDREPERGEVVGCYAAETADIGDLRRAFLGSAEVSGRLGNLERFGW